LRKKIAQTKGLRCFLCRLMLYHIIKAPRKGAAPTTCSTVLRWGKSPVREHHNWESGRFFGPKLFNQSGILPLGTRVPCSRNFNNTLSTYRAAGSLFLSFSLFYFFYDYPLGFYYCFRFYFYPFVVPVGPFCILILFLG
jgi:hypothetical protein